MNCQILPYDVADGVCTMSLALPAQELLPSARTLARDTVNTVLVSTAMTPQVFSKDFS